MSSLKVLVIGGSKNIGYYAACNLLQKGATVTFLLRNPKCFEADETIQGHVRSGKARIVAGDALNQEQVASAWAKAGEGDRPGEVDVFLFTVGGTPQFTIHGAKISPPDLCSRSMLTSLRAMPSELRVPGRQPRIVAISSTGTTEESHKELPLMWRVIYPWLLSGPHADKLALEQALAHVAGTPWDAKNGSPANAFSDSWRTQPGTPSAGEINDVVVVCPAFLTDGPLKGEYRTGGKNYYTVGRQDVAHFITEKVLNDWNAFKGRAVSIGY